LTVLAQCVVGAVGVNGVPVLQLVRRL